MGNDDYYASAYECVIGTGGVGYVASIYHKMLERGHSKKFEVCLELGAGNGRHFQYVKHDFDLYISSDIRKVTLDTFRSDDDRHVFQILDAENLKSIKNESIDRLVVTCVLAHLHNPEKALLEWRRVLKIGGVLDLYAPCEPGFLLGLAQSLTTRRKVQKLGFNYESIQYREHRNHFPLMRMLLREIFVSDYCQIKSFPNRIFGWQLRLFDVYRIVKSGK